jgi:glycosyltransferase involved in cell wall biosynthesis
VRVAVLTTSYPRSANDPAGRFVADAVERLRARGVEVEVVSPGAFRDYGLASGNGVVREARRRPWAAPPMLASMLIATRRAAQTADLVHAHWLPAGAVAARSGKPFVVTLHGTDVVLARRAPRLARWVLGAARGVMCVSSALADEARRLGAPDPVVVPNGVEIPAEPGVEKEPPFVLYSGRLSAEKGIRELVAAAAGLELTVAGDGPLRADVPQALGFVPREALQRLYGEAAVLACPSHREGFGLACAEAMACGTPVVASAVGGLLDLVQDGETGLLVPPGDVAALRAALERLLADRGLRARLGTAARERVAALCDWDDVTDRTLAVYASGVTQA